MQENIERERKEILEKILLILAQIEEERKAYTEAQAQLEKQGVKVAKVVQKKKSNSNKVSWFNRVGMERGTGPAISKKNQQKGYQEVQVSEDRIKRYENLYQSMIHTIVDRKSQSYYRNLKEYDALQKEKEKMKRDEEEKKLQEAQQQKI